MKVATIIGTRPEIIRLSRVMAALDRYVDHVIIHTGQNYDYELNEIFFEDLELRRPDFFLNASGENAAETIGLIICASDKVLSEIDPDAALILGDTNSSLAAISAKKRKIPIFHMEAGNRCFDERVPEEINRKIVDHISDINLPYSRISREYLLKEGIHPDRIIKTGSPMYEVLHYYMPKIESSKILEELALEKGNYFVVSCHREENADSERNLSNFIEVLEGLISDFGMRIIVTCHPRMRKRLEARETEFSQKVLLHKPFGLCDYVKLEINSKAVLSDSGTITEESSILNFPAINIREAHERPEGMEEGAVIMTGLKWRTVKQALDIIDSQGRCDQRTLCPVVDYMVPNVSEKVVRIILSYTELINRNVWHK